jgi:spore maturation protein SpmA/spore maturation protein SpmB
MNAVFFALIALAFGVAGWYQIAGPTGDAMSTLGTAVLKSAQDAVTLGISLIGTMAIFVGILKVAEAGGLMAAVARGLRPLLRGLFPEVPPAHPAMGAMVMNVAANVVGVSNAATPFGLRAMRALNELNPEKGTATDAMVLFLAINTANVTILPTHVLALRTAVGAHDPAAIIPTTLFATLGATAVAILVAKGGRRWFPGPVLLPAPDPVSQREPAWTWPFAVGAVCALLPLMLLWGRAVSPWIIPALLTGSLGWGLWRGVAIYTVFARGARDGLMISLRIMPYLIAILVAVGMLRASGAMELLLTPLGRWTAPLGVPPEAVTMAVLRSLSGSASFGYLASTLGDPAVGPDSYVGILISTIYGSSETTFYVLAVYFGAAGVRNIRHALLTGVLTDLAALAFSVLICSVLYR